MSAIACINLIKANRIEELAGAVSICTLRNLRRSLYFFANVRQQGNILEVSRIKCKINAATRL